MLEPSEMINLILKLFVLYSRHHHKPLNSYRYPILKNSLVHHSKATSTKFPFWREKISDFFQMLQRHPPCHVLFCR
uniref:Uncharacterized protein n=1 Tax=Arundo donax TaxID=35708 RepID=A0A0A9DFK3_ARUDO